MPTIVKGSGATSNTNSESVIGNIATVEASPATATHTAGEYIVWNNQLYIVTTDIAVGETLDTSTNISATNIGDFMKTEIYSITTEPAAAMEIVVRGKIAIVSLKNAFPNTAIPSSGYQLPFIPVNTGSGNWVSVCMYYPGSGENAYGFIRVRSDGILELLDSRLRTISNTYITGQIAFPIE